MKGGKVEGKPMGPLFPRLHISDADKGGPRGPPRNKMALCEQYNVSSQGAKFRSGSGPLLPLLPSNGHSSFPSQASSSNVGGDKGKVLSTSGSISGLSNLTERSYSHFRDGAISNTVLTKSEPWMSWENYQNSYTSDDLTTKPKCLAQPNGCPSYGDCYTRIPGDENKFKAPYFIQSGKSLNYGKLQLHPGNERGTSFNQASSGELHNVFLKLPKITSGDRASERRRNVAEETSKLMQDNEDCPEKPSPNIGDLRPTQLKKISLEDEQTTVCDPYAQSLQDCKMLQKGRIFADVKSGIPGTATKKRCALEMNGSSCTSPQRGESNKLTKVDLNKECLKDENYCETSPTGNADKMYDISDYSTVASARDLDLTPDDVVSVIGHKLFWKARKTIVHQQRVFSFQIFELHRLVKVQRLIARSPEMLHESHFNPNKPSIQFPPMNKLLFVTPLDPLPADSKTRTNALKPYTDKDCKAEAVSTVLPLPASDTEIGHVDRQIAPRSLLPMLPSISTDGKLAPLPMPVSIPTDSKLAPWCFHPVPGGQWLVPIRSPSEGLIYKSYPGPCFPSSGLMTPVYGNCGPISVNTMGGMAYGVPLGQNYFQPYGMQSINATGLKNLEGEQMNSSSGFQVAGLDKNLSTSIANVPCETLSRVLSEQSATLSDLGKKTDGQGSSPSSPSERRDAETLSLFPTMPSSQVQNEQSKVEVIKVVPHSHKSAAESAARIFQSIQEERKRA